MKIGVRKPSIKKRITGRTTSKYTRRVKKMINPAYGKRGVGVIKNPERALKNAVYKRTTIGFSSYSTEVSKYKEREHTSTETDESTGAVIICFLMLVVVLVGVPMLIYFLLPDAIQEMLVLVFTSICELFAGKN